MSNATTQTTEKCASCQEEDFSPNVEAFEEFNLIVCDECAEALFEEKANPLPEHTGNRPC